MAKKVSKKVKKKPNRTKSAPSVISDKRLSGSVDIPCLSCSVTSPAKDWMDVDYDCSHCSEQFDSGKHMAIECPLCGAESRWSYQCEKEFPFEPV